MKFFTTSEKHILVFLALLLLCGLVVKQGRDYFQRSTVTNKVLQEDISAAFQEGYQRYLETADSGAEILWAIGLERPLDINHAGIDELQVLPGIGPVLAKKIVVYRKKNGYFQTVQDLTKVKGIGPKLLMRWEGLIAATPNSSVKRGSTVE
ncbi:MAG: helix-hairpin-helix domain-containing protein [Fidelibacterota bacterium]|nr:MAG: helix-hairpin-helix domain-containing protein [Candidatus Neomarinimicrobiota bacterium]